VTDSTSENTSETTTDGVSVKMLGNLRKPPVRKSRWTLRRRLVFATVGLLAAVSTVIGIVSVVALQGSLMDRLDTQLIAATNRTQGVVDGPGRQTNANTNTDTNTDGDDDRPRPSDFLRLAGLPPGTVGAIVRGGTVEGWSPAHY
jgi:two-component system OmpR family sensor kinase